MTDQQTRTLKLRWRTEAEKHLLGRKIIDVRWMTDDEQDGFAWQNAALMLLLDNGTVIWPSADDEGNDAGALFGLTPAGEDFTLPVIG